MSSNSGQVCPGCGSTDFDETEDGAWTCLECGQQLHGMRAEMNEGGGQTAQFAGAGLGMTRFRAPRPRAAQEADTPAGSSSSGAGMVRDIPVTLVFEAFQRVLQALLKAAVDPQRACALSAQLVPQVGSLWHRLARLFARALAGQETIRTTPHLQVLRSESSDYAHLSLTPTLGVGLMYLGCLELGLTVRAHELVGWCTAGTLPFLSAYRSLPERLQCVARSLGGLAAVVHPKNVPDARAVRHTGCLLCEALGMAAPAPPLMDPLIRHLFEQIGCPDDAAGVVLAIGAATLASARSKKRPRDPASYTIVNNGHRDTWRRAVAAVIVAVKMRHSMLLPLVRQAWPSGAPASDGPSQSSVGTWGAIEGRLWEWIRGASAGETPVSAVPASVLPTLLLDDTRLAAYTQFVAAHILLDDHPRPEIMQEARALESDATRYPHLRDAPTSAAPPSLAPPRTTGQAAAGASTAAGGGGEARQPGGGTSSEARLPSEYELSADFALGEAWRPAVVGRYQPDAAELPPRYVLLIRGAAAVLREHPSVVHEAVVQLESALFSKHTREKAEPAYGASCAHCGRTVASDRGRCVGCDTRLRECGCAPRDVLPLCEPCQGAGVARRSNGSLDASSVRRPVPLRCTACEELFWSRFEPHLHRASEGCPVAKAGRKQPPEAVRLTAEECARLQGTAAYEFGWRISGAAETRRPPNRKTGATLHGWARAELPASSVLGLPSTWHWVSPQGKRFKEQSAAELARRLVESGGDISTLAQDKVLPATSPRRAFVPRAVTPSAAPAAAAPAAAPASHEADGAATVTYDDIERGFSRCYAMRGGGAGIRSADMRQVIEAAGCDFRQKSSILALKLLNAWVREHFEAAIEDGRVQEYMNKDRHYWKGFVPLG